MCKRISINKSLLYIVFLSFFIGTFLSVSPVRAQDKQVPRVQKILEHRQKEAMTQHDKSSSDLHEIMVGALKRQYLLFVPSPARKNIPLIIALHGGYGTGEKMEKITGLNSYAKKYGFLVAYPDAYRQEGSKKPARWNDGRDTLEPSTMNVDDVAFIAALIKDVSYKYGIDRKRVFVTGASNGGIMSYRLGCELKGTLRAIAPEIGNVAQPLSGQCESEKGLSVLSINGSEDPLVPLNGGQVCKDVSEKMCEGGYVLSRADSIDYFVRANGCHSTPKMSQRPPKVQDGTIVEDLLYENCSSGATVRSIIVQGMGHSWPPRKPQTKKSGPTSQNLNATQEIVSFFLNL